MEGWRFGSTSFLNPYPVTQQYLQFCIEDCVHKAHYDVVSKLCNFPDQAHALKSKNKTKMNVKDFMWSKSLSDCA